LVKPLDDSVDHAVDASVACDADGRVAATSLLFHDLSMVREGDEVVVGRLKTGTYVVLPVDGAELLSQLMDGVPPAAAAQWYESTYDEQVDVEDFLDSLRELGFVYARGEAASELPVPTAPIRLRWLARALFSPLASICYAVLVSGWVLAMARHADLLPRPKQVFFTGSLVIVQLVIIVAQIPLIFLHEGCHVLAGRRLGLPSEVGVSNRLIDIVFETRMNGLLSVPRRLRYLPLLAGMLCDVVVCAILGLVADASRTADGALPLLGRMALALAFTGVVRIAWQFQFYLRTDLYYVLATALNCHELHEASMAQIRNRFYRLARKNQRTVRLDEWSERDLRIGRWYGPLIVVGIAVLLTITAFASAPIAAQYIRTVTARLSDGQLDARFWDVVLSLALNVANVAALLYLARRKRQSRSADIMFAEPTLAESSLAESTLAHPIKER
jgi:hypothetical protein